MSSAITDRPAFLKSKFDHPRTPGSHHVNSGSYMIINARNEKQTLNKSSWTSMVYPGCRLSMTIIFHILRLSLLRCPRPGCGNVPFKAVEEGGFVEWYAHAQYCARIRISLMCVWQLKVWPNLPLQPRHRAALYCQGRTANRATTARRRCSSIWCKACSDRSHKTASRRSRPRSRS